MSEQSSTSAARIGLERRRTAPRASNSRSPFLVIRSTGTASSARKRRTARCQRRRARTPTSATRQREPVSRSASAPGGAPDHLDDVQARRQRGVEGGPHRARARRPRPARSRGTPPRWPRRSATALAYEIRGCGREAGRVRHRHPGPAQRPLEGPAEVAVAGEPGPAALGVLDPEPLHRRRLLLRLGLATDRSVTQQLRLSSSKPGCPVDTQAQQPGTPIGRSAASSCLTTAPRRGRP